MFVPIGKPFKSGVSIFMLAAEPHPLTPEERSAASKKAWDVRGRTGHPTQSLEALIDSHQPIDVYHAPTKGEIVGQPSTDIGSDFDVLGKGFYFGTHAMASNYGTPMTYRVFGPFA